MAYQQEINNHTNALYNSKVLEWDGIRGKLKVCKVLKNYENSKAAFPKRPLYLHIKMDNNLKNIAVNDYIEIKIKEIESNSKYPKYTISQIVSFNIRKRFSNMYNKNKKKAEKAEEAEVVEEAETVPKSNNPYALLYDSDSE